jgi:cell fate regulator YaaT (PSP1 superfamily)
MDDQTAIELANNQIKALQAKVKILEKDLKNHRRRAAKNANLIAKLYHISKMCSRAADNLDSELTTYTNDLLKDKFAPSTEELATDEALDL